MSQLYYFEFSPPCRAVALTARILGVKFEKKNVNLITGEQNSEQIKEFNSEGVIPIFINDGLPLCESRAIMKYLVRKYGKKNDPLYPNDLKKMYNIDRFLDFDATMLFGKYKDLMHPFFVDGTAPDVQKRQALLNSAECLEKHLAGKKFITGDEFTLADISLLVTASQMVNSKIDMSKYHNIISWLELCKTTIPYCNEENEMCLNAVKKFVANKFSDLGL